ncbi:centromere-associated protein E isoform X4 [Canis lupus familiaris]|uniref:centromere-associated protein E isoform X4 n=1 Tax=Canis lupus familiaris TaxID=9615 RepID=UPI000BAA08BA|nr:centromere-associated protein E isoform X4 [Canis lupus familiaris]XP_038300204.1 centromere-associated protein E isoform X4 [Canis lupus familiaris]XP_038437925.1 centromere-associated protein E isoform X4 [Canis lupus familiaris]|eukprot:XP_022269203.1 centromere-associated protein E isoform X4 [Canis lupus familiaris]
MAEEGAVAVCVRVRPLNDREEALGGDTQIYWKTDNNAIYQVDGSKSFNFDRVFHSNETTKHVYEEIAVPIIDSAIQGYNGTIFAYGQTASGKTYTMMGSQDYLGVIPRAIHDIFQKIKKFPDREFLLRVSYMEIYNETITDLLCDTQKMKPLIIREDFNRNVYVADLTEEVVYTSDMALKWITKGEKNRHYGITKMNQRSSRSHTIFRMILESREKGEPSNCDGSVKVSHLNLVDLAGSERAAQTGAEGVRLKEGCNINRSLFILGQVIKKLSDGQVGGFINYRDSKLTRILQNSLGGNAKTRIICTVTPVSFDETLTTLQFASTAKYMKNTPYVNEVSSDEALLKRYRKEIMDLKKQLEEVSLETRAQAMEKDQLAQLLEEKDLLQKVQTEKIQNLTRMLVTSSSLTSHQELKAKRKRRVTWCLGKINKMKDSNYINEFNMSTNITTRKAALTVVGEIDESLCSESDVFSNTFDTLNETEWNPATKLLSQENLESELNSLRANYDNLVLDYEQLRQEHEEMELKLKEKNDLDEFEALERKAEKDQEMQLIHEISNLKNLVKHAEVYNQDLENELSSKVELLREKEDQIKKLQKYIDSQKSEDIKTDLSYSSESTEDLKQMKQTLLDAETVVLDAKRESAFLRSENLELKEKMKELRSRYKQMENDIQLYQRQLEAKKKMQVDLEKELQSSFNEITKLTSLIDGKVPKGLLCNLELERKITDFQRELNEKVEENEALHKEVKLLSALKSLPSEIEMLRKEIHDKSEELYIITSEREKLNSEVVQKESRIQDLLEEIGKTKNDLATIRLNYESTDQEFQDFKNHHIELEQKYKMVLEENARMNQELGNLSEQAQKLGLSLDALSNTELSPKSEELLQKTTESQKRLNEVEELKEQLESTGSRLQTIEKEKTLIAEQLQQTLVEVRTLTQEKDDLKQLQESLQIERDQLKSDIQDTVNMNIDTQEQLRNALEALKQHQEVINTLRLKIAEKTSRHLETEENLGEAKDEFQEEMVDTDKKQNLKAKNTQALVVNVEDNELTEQQRNIFSLIQEKNELQRMLESVTAEKEQLKTDLRENIEMTIENQEELRILGDELKKQQEILVQEKNHTIKKEEELSRTYKKLAEVEEKLKEKNQQLQEKQLQLLSVQEEMSEMQKKMNEMENVNNEFRNRELTLERIEMERLEVAQKLHENDEEMKSLTKERNDLKELQESFELEREQLEGFIREIEVTIPVLHEEQELLPNVKEVSATQGTMNEGEILKKQSKTKDSMTPARIEIERLGLTAKLPESHEEIKSLTEERDNLKTIKEAVQVGQEQLKEDSREMLAEDSLNISEPQNKQEQSFDMKEREDEAEEIVSELEQLQEQLKAKEAPQPRVGMERLEMSEKLQEVLQSETNQLKENMREIIAKHLETEEELKVARCHLKEQEETIDKLRVNLSERETELSSLQKELEITNNELQKKIQELHEKQQFMSTKEITETQEKMSELEQLKEQLRVKDSSLQNIESEKLKLTEKLQESQDKIKIVIKERDELKRVQELLQMERDQLKANIKEIVAEEYQQTISTRNISKKTDQEANIERVIESSDAESQEKIQELQEKEHQLLKMKTVSETQEKICEMEHLKNQFEAQKSTLENIEMENARLTQRLHENLEEMRSVTKERDDLRSIEETLKVERDQLKENLRETVIRDLEKQEELRIARMHVKEHQETIDKLRGLVSEKTDELSNMQIDLENTNDALKTQIQELQEKEHQLLKVKNDLRENMYQTEQLKEQLQAQHSTLESVETERLRLSQKLHENLEEIKCVTEERDTLKRAERTLRMEQCQLRESLREKEAQDLEKQEELRIVCMHVKEHQETIDKLRGLVSEKTDEIANMQMDLENSNAKLQEKIQQLKANEHQLFKLKEDVSETQKKTSEIERLKKQLKGQSLTLDKIEMENLNLAQKLHENLEEMKSVMQERDNLKLERDQLKTNLQETIARDQQNQKEIVKYEKRLQCNEKHHLTESLREKCSRIKELLKRYSEMYNHYECLTRLSLDLEKEIETQKELSVTIKANLSLPHSQIKQIEKLLAVNQRCSMEFHRIIKRFQYVLSQITKIKEEQHESINKLEVVFIDEVEKHNELVIKIQHLQQDFNVPSGELTDLKLSQKMDLRIEEILKDLSENDFHLLKTEFQQVLSNRREITQFLEEWLNTHFDIEKLKNGIQKENDNICQVNNFYNNKIIAIMNESTEFEERYAIIAKEWERDLNSVKEKNEQLFKNYQTLKLTRTSGIPVNSATEDNKNLHVTSGATQLTTEKIQELEASLHEAKESALHKENKIVKMQKELEMTNDIIAKLQSQVNESNKCLEKTKERIQLLQDKVALGAKPYKEEIEDLKMKLVKMDLEKKKNAKEFEKEITSTKATVEHQKEVIRVLRENLRRNQQAQDTSIVSEYTDSQPPNKPLTCGGGSGIVQSTKALILKSGYIRLEKEISKLKQQNEQLIKQKNELLSNNHHLSNEVKTWKERILKREAHREVTCENSPQSPKVTITAPKKRPHTPSQCKERNLQDPVPRESPKSWFFDSRSKSLPSPHPVRYFDNSGLGLCPEEQIAGAENVDPQPGLWHASSGKDVPECKTQ